MENEQTTPLLSVENVGPIQGAFDVGLDGPGLYELRGSKGKGKSTILSCLSILAGCKTALTVHDSEPEGEITGFGTTIPIGTRRKPVGILEATMIESEKFDLVDLIDPQGKTPATRDSARIKALASLSGTELKPEDFYELVGGETNYNDLQVEDTPEPVLLAKRVKTKLDSQAKELEVEAGVIRGRSEALRDRCKGLDLAAPADPDQLNLAVLEAAQALSALTERQQAFEKTLIERASIEEKLNDARGSWKGPDRSKLEERIRLTKSEKVQSTADLTELHNRLKELEEQFEIRSKADKAIEDRLVEQEKELKMLNDHEEVIRKYDEVLHSPVETPVTQLDIELCTEQLAKARQLQEDGVRIRDGLVARDEAEVLALKAKSVSEAASHARDKAQGAFEVLANKLDTKYIKVKGIKGDLRLVVDHARGKDTLFDQDDGLSDGERVMTSIKELLPRLPAPGVFPVPQRTYQDLPPQDREELAQYAKDNGLYVFGAQVTDGDLEVHKL